MGKPVLCNGVNTKLNKETKIGKEKELVDKLNSVGLQRGGGWVEVEEDIGGIKGNGKNTMKNKLFF